MIRQLVAVFVFVVVTQFHVAAADAAFSASQGSNASFGAATLGAPSGFSLAPNGNVLACAVSLIWTSPSGSPATGFVVQRYLAGVPSGSPLVLSAGVTTALDNTLSMLVPYTWKVHAVLGNWVSPSTSLSYNLTSGCL